LFPELTNLFTAVIVSDKTNHKIQEMIDTHEMIEVHDFPPNEKPVEKIIELKNHEMINF
jgi:hypothetical protein